MARYFFHLHDRSGWTRDTLGRNLADDDQARMRAIKEARSIIQADVEKGVVDLTSWVDVTEDMGRVVLRLPFVEAVELITVPAHQAKPVDRGDPV